MSDNEANIADKSPDRGDKSPDRSDKSPVRSPVRSDRSPVRSERSPVRSERSPVRSERSPVRSDRSRDRSSTEKSPRGRKRSRSRTRSRSRSRSRSAGSNRDDRRRPRRRYNNDARCELRMLIQSKDAGSIIGRGGANIKRLRQDCKAGVTISDSRTPERIVSITGDVSAISDVLEEILKVFEEKHDSARRDAEVEGKMLIHQSQAGCVIGKAGTKLKEIRLEAGVDMKVYPQCCPRSTERIVQVVGRPHNVCKCMTKVVDMLRTWPPRGPSNPYDPANYDEIAVRDYGGFQDEDRGRGRDRDRGRRSSLNRDRGGGGSLSDVSGGLASLSSLLGGDGRRTTQQVSIPADLAGVIIGKGGQNIRQIRIDSGAEVELSDPTGGPGDRVITIAGTPSQIQNAQFMLQMSVKQHLARN